MQFPPSLSPSLVEPAGLFKKQLYPLRPTLLLRSRSHLPPLTQTDSTTPSLRSPSSSKAEVPRKKVFSLPFPTPSSSLPIFFLSSSGPSYPISTGKEEIPLHNLFFPPLFCIPPAAKVLISFYIRVFGRREPQSRAREEERELEVSKVYYWKKERKRERGLMRIKTFFASSGPLARESRSHFSTAQIFSSFSIFSPSFAYFLRDSPFPSGQIGKGNRRERGRERENEPQSGPIKHLLSLSSWCQSNT